MGVRPSIRTAVPPTGALLLAALLAWRWGGVAPRLALIVAAILCALAWLAPRLYAPIQRRLEQVSAGVLKVLSWVLLAAVFAVIFIPGRLFFPTRRKAASPAGGSFWRPARPFAGKSSFERQY